MTVRISDLLALEDPEGFLTITASFAPETFDDRGPSAPPEVRAGLRSVRRRLEGSRREAFDTRVEELKVAIEDLLDPRGSGRGRVLVAGLSTDALHDLRLQVPLPTEVRVEDGPALRRVLEVVDEHGPAGVLLLHREEALLLHLELGIHTPLRSWTVELGDPVFAEEFYGPSPSSPNSVHRGVRHREARQDRIQANLDRFLGDAAEDVRGLLAEHDLDRIVLVGPSHERSVVADALASVNGLRVLHLDRVADGPSTALVDAVQEVLQDAHRTEEVELVRAAIDREAAGGAAALGVAGVVRALGEGRVHHLLLTPDADRSGWIDESGNLATTREDARLTDPREEPRLVHRMVERALATDAAVTPVDGEAAELLAQHDDVAALLRW